MIPGIAPQISSAILSALPQNTAVYLVGGAVRDLLLRRRTHDLDFVVLGSGKNCARSVAKALDAPYYPLNDIYDTGRVLYTPPAVENVVPPPLKIDFSGSRGGSLDADLRARDFTINAIALEFSDTGRMIDPLHGAADIQNRVIRICSPTSFSDDPLRIVRAVRLANTLDFSIEKGTRLALAESLPHLTDVSVERIRDEVLRIAGGVRPARAFRLMDALGIIPLVFPELPALKGMTQSPPHVYAVWDHTLAVLAKLDELLAKFAPDFIPDEETGFSSDLATGLAVMRLGIFRRQIQEHLETVKGADVPQRALLMLAALYHDSGKPAKISLDAAGRTHFFNHEDEGAHLASTRARSLHMSNAENTWLETVIKNHMRPLQLSLEDGLPSRRAVYRFFQATGSAGVDVCLLALADFLGTYDYELPEKKWTHFLEVIRVLLDGWWNQKESVVAPPALINGDEIMQIFHLQPGPFVGVILAKIREAQATGEIAGREEALHFADGLITQQDHPSA